MRAPSRDSTAAGREDSRLGGRVFTERTGCEGAFLRPLFRRFAEATVRYAVLRNHELLPESAGGSDLDIVVHPEDAALLRAVVASSLEDAGGVVLGSSHSDGFLKLCLAGRAPLGSGEPWGLTMDVNLGMSFRGAPYVAPSRLPSVTLEQRGVRVLSPAAASVLGVLKDALNNDEVDLRYLEHANALDRREWERLEPLLSPMGHAVEVLRSLIREGRSRDAVRKHARRVRRLLLRKALAEAPAQYLRHRWAHEWSKCTRLCSPPGVVIAVLGVDGVGKSTVIEEITPMLREATHGALFVRHLRPGVLPPLAVLKGARSRSSAATTSPHGSHPSGTAGSILRLGYYSADYVLGYWLRIRPTISRRPAVWLFDRYSYDMELDPRRMRVGVSSRVARLFAEAAPAPDLILCLHAAPTTIARRKQELPLQEVDRQLTAMRVLAARHRNAVLVSTEGTPGEVRDRVADAVLDFFSRRARSRP